MVTQEGPGVDSGPFTTLEPVNAAPASVYDERRSDSYNGVHAYGRPPKYGSRRRDARVGPTDEREYTRENHIWPEGHTGTAG